MTLGVFQLYLATSPSAGSFFETRLVLVAANVLPDAVDEGAVDGGATALGFLIAR